MAVDGASGFSFNRRRHMAATKALALGLLIQHGFLCLRLVKVPPLNNRNGVSTPFYDGVSDDNDFRT